MRATALLAALVLTLLLGSCITVNPHYDARKPHHRPEGFQNNHIRFEPRGLDDLLRWRWQAWQDDLPRRPQTPTPAVRADLDFIHRNAHAGAAMEPAITWIGHATMLVQMGGRTLITDPMFSERASPVGFAGPQRAQPPGLALRELPRVDLVLVSHDHYDHLDEASVAALQAQPGGPPQFVAPLGVGRLLRDMGATRVTELDWWDKTQVDGLEIVLTPAQHWSGRGLYDRMSTLWGGFAVFHESFHLFYSGDTGHSPDFAEIAHRFAPRQRGSGFDLALLPVGAYEPRWFMREQHVNPAEAVQIHREIGALRSVGVHWGTFELTDESLDEPPHALAEARRAQGVADEAFGVMAVGETRRLPRRKPQ